MMRILSLGAGVQSTTLALMAAHGEIEPPDCAIFADTQSEAQGTYNHLAALELKLPFWVYRVTRGNLESDFMDALASEKTRCGQPPFFVRNSDNSGGMLRRECTKEYKLDPIRKKVRALSLGKPVEQWIGISTDESHRMKPNGVKYITNRYPLIEMGMSRGDCMAWLLRHHYAIPPKSACYFCPYTSDSRWMEMKRNASSEWLAAVSFDKRLRTQRVTKLAAGIKGEIFVHRSMKPLDEADLGDEDTIDMFANECEGMCGV